MTRRERRLEAKQNKETFTPEYNGRFITKAEYDKEVAELKEEMEKAREKLLNGSKEETIEEVSESTEQ